MEQRTELDIEIFQETMREHYKWLDTNGMEGKQGDLSNYLIDEDNIRRFYFPDSRDFRKIIMKNAEVSFYKNDGRNCFYRANFNGADLENTKFHYVDLELADFENCNLKNTNFYRCRLNDAKFDFFENNDLIHRLKQRILTELELNYKGIDDPMLLKGNNLIKQWACEIDDEFSLRVKELGNDAAMILTFGLELYRKDFSYDRDMIIWFLDKYNSCTLRTAIIGFFIIFVEVLLMLIYFYNFS
jgi:uncharacterized protein YjbI with pentapeptide repeats